MIEKRSRPLCVTTPSCPHGARCVTPSFAGHISEKCPIVPDSPRYLRLTVGSGGLLPAYIQEGRALSTTADHAEGRGVASRLGLQSGQVVQEIGYDDDCDDAL